eukprot:gene11073-7878_t
MTYVLVIYGMYATTFGVIIPWLGFSLFGLLNILVFNGLSLLTIYTHFKTMTTDPGAVPKDARPLPNDVEEHDFEGNDRDRFKKFCRRCSAFKPIRAHHCSICGRCVVKMDHHCPWVNNCVGVGNHKLFLLFCFYVFVTCSYSMLLTCSRFLICVYRDNCQESPIPELFLVFLVIEGILFGLFTLCMIGDQMTVIMTNQTQIDRLKNKKYDIQTEVHEVFGTPSRVSFLWSWFMPVPTSFPHHVRDIIMGFRMLNDNREEENPLLGSAAAASGAGIMMTETAYGQAGATGNKGTAGGLESAAEEDQLAESLFATPGSSNSLRPRIKRKVVGGDPSSEESSFTGDDAAEWSPDGAAATSGTTATAATGSSGDLSGSASAAGASTGGASGVGSAGIEVSVPVTSAGDYGGNVRKRV